MFGSTIDTMPHDLDGQNPGADAPRADECPLRRSAEGVRSALRCAAPVGQQPCDLPNALAGRPRINIQNDKGKAKAYQVRQVLQALDKLKGLQAEPGNHDEH
jgi:hypothetical protein